MPNFARPAERATFERLTFSSLRKQGPNIRAFTPVFDGLCSRALSNGCGVWVPALRPGRRRKCVGLGAFGAREAAPIPKTLQQCYPSASTGGRNNHEQDIRIRAPARHGF